MGDLEQAHVRRLRRHSRIVATLLTTVDALDMAVALVRARRRDGSRVLPSAAPSMWLSNFSWLDVKLSVRMLRKHPGLSTVSWIGMTFGVTVGACAFGVIHGVTSATLPLEQGDRIVAVQNAFQLGLDPARSTHLHALELWRPRVSAFNELGAYRVSTRNLITAEGAVAPERVVEMTASGFRIARVPPLLGRTLDDADEAQGAPRVVVIGHGVWRDRFGGASDVIGRTLQIGATPHVVVGVMPQGFAFPIADRVWTPLRLNPVDYDIAQAPPIDVFARLAPGASIELATIQVRAVAQPYAEIQGDGRGEIQTYVFPYTQTTLGASWAWALYVVQTVVSLILVLIAMNVSVLVYARTVARFRELSVRAALGASRQRIITQLFLEAFLLSGLAAVSGLAAATLVLDRVELSILSREGAPFWWNFNLTPEALAYGFLLAIVAAVVVGVVPALGATGRSLNAHLQRAGSSVSSPQLGRTWTALIVLQIAVAVAILPVSLSSVARYALQSMPEVSYPLNGLLSARIQLDEDPSVAPSMKGPDAWQRRYDERLSELTRRLEARAEIEAVALMGTPPWLDPDLPFEMDGSPADPLIGAAMGSASTGHAVGRSTVSPNLFNVVDLPVLAGRRLNGGDAVEGSTSIVVNQRFEELVLGGASAVGRNIRFPTYTNPELGTRSELEGAGQPWYTIVGVIPSFPPHYGMSNPEAKAYLPLLPGHEGPQTILLRIRATVAGPFTSQLRRLVADVDPLLRLERAETIEAMAQRDVETPLFLGVVVGLSTSVLLLAIAGMYAMMSFIVVRQRREIGIRVALGARPARVLGSILSRAAWRLAVGVGVGLLFAGVFDRLLGGETLGGQHAYLLPAVAILMMVIGVLAAWAPAREGMRIQPTEALRAD